MIAATGCRLKRPSKLLSPLFNDTLRLFKRRTNPKGIPADVSRSASRGGKRKKSYCWEVVEHIDIVPVVTVSRLNEEFLRGDAMLRVARQDISRTYVFYVRPKDNQPKSTQQALIFARRQLLDETRQYGFNSFIREGWELTLFRNHNRWRIEVRYTARPAFMADEFQSNTPPFIEMLVSR